MFSSPTSLLNFVMLSCSLTCSLSLSQRNKIKNERSKKQHQKKPPQKQNSKQTGKISMRQKNPQRKQNKTKKYTKTLLSQFCVSRLLLTLDCGWSKSPPRTPCDIPLDKTLCSRYQLQITSWLGVRPCPLPPFSVRAHLASTCPGLVCVATVSVSS